MLVETQRPIEFSDDAEYRLVTVKRRYGGLISRGIMKGREILVKSQFVVRAGDFLISKRQIVHNACGLVTQELDGSVVSNEYSVLTPKPGCSIEFFSWFAMQPAVSASFMNCSVGIVIEKMLFKLPAWLKQEFLFPTLPEQQRIASCLGSLDALITAETQKFEALKTHKKGLMQQLFPSPEELEA
jgi:type I restriction enzyme S subunit